MGPHMFRELEKLKKMILAVASEVESNLRLAVKAVSERDNDLALRVIDGDHEVDRKEVEAEEEALKILALYQPVANDLRYIIAMLKINHDLERIGDLTVTIAERAHALNTSIKPNLDFDLAGMAEKTQTMVARSIDALINRDLDLAQQIWFADDEVDARNRVMYSQVIEEIRKNPDHLESYLSIISVFRALERVADHATNISKDVIYMVEGKIVRHRSREMKNEEAT
jgi:phosphate transport system protein